MKMPKLYSSISHKVTNLHLSNNIYIMKTPIRILAFGGSLRRDSINQLLASAVADGARAEDVEVSVISLRDYPMPIFDEDYEKEHGKPQAARDLKKLFAEHQGLIIASPEYNSSVTAALKNAIDWVSRADDASEAPLAALAGKTAVICAASPGGYGGLRGLVHLRAILGNIGITVLPDQLALGSAFSAFSPEGKIVDEAMNQRAQHLGKTLANHLKKLLA